jgi:transposase
MDEIKREIVLLWDSGASVGKICRALPRREGTIKRLVKEMRESGELQDRGSISEITRTKVIALYKSGQTNPYEIAKAFGLAVSTVNGILGNAKLNRGRPKHNYKARRLRELSELGEITQLVISDLKAGLKPREIARKRDLSTQWVYEIKKKYIDTGRV